MRAKSKWTPGGIGLWLIAAVVATFVVCAQSRPAAGPPAPANEADLEIEIVE